MSQTHVLAAGGIVVRAGARPVIAVVQRRKDGAWVLPKGKLNPGEKAAAAARREVIEETGQDVAVHDFLGALTYDRGRKSKLVQFWRMETVGNERGKLMRDIKAVRWLPLKAAIEKLDDPLERVFLRHVGRRVIMLSRTRSDRAVAAPEEAAAETSPLPQVVVTDASNIRPGLLQRALQMFTRAMHAGAARAGDSST